MLKYVYNKARYVFSDELSINVSRNLRMETESFLNSNWKILRLKVQIEQHKTVKTINKKEEKVIFLKGNLFTNIKKIFSN